MLRRLFPIAFIRYNGDAFYQSVCSSCDEHVCGVLQIGLPRPRCRLPPPLPVADIEQNRSSQAALSWFRLRIACCKD